MSAWGIDKVAHVLHHPEEHKHTFKGLLACSTDPTHQALDLSVMDAHERFAPITVNHGKDNCDVTEGACACGGTH